MLSLRYSLALLLLCVAAQAQNTAELALKGGQTHFYSGEPILLEVTTRTTQSDCSLVSDTRPSPMDTVELSPDEGAFRWRQGNGDGSDSSGWSKLEPSKPSTDTLVLNDLYRFDAAGTYTVRVKTRHLHCGELFKGKPLELSTNAVTFTVEPYPAEQEKALAQSLEQRIRAATDECKASELATQLDYLPGDDATRAKLSLLFDPKTFYPFGVQVGEGLWIARNRPMVVAALKRALADPSIEADEQLLSLLTQLESNPQQPRSAGFAMALPAPDPHRAEYLQQIALSLPRRTGDSQLTAALMVFEADKSLPALKPDFDAAREIVITHFAQVNEYNVGGLLQRNGAYLEDRRIVPALQALIDHSAGVFSSNRTEAMKQMQRILPGGLDAYLVQEACADHPAGIKDVRDLTHAETLPAVDPCLGERLGKALADPHANSNDFERTLEYLARFADAALVPEVLAAYRSRKPDDRRWGQGSTGAALCYLMRWDPAEATPLLLEVLDGDIHTSPVVLFGVVAPALPSAQNLRTVFRQRIEAAGPDAPTVVFALAEIGTPADRAWLRTRLEALHRKDSSNFSPAEQRLELELVSAQLRGRTWESTGEEGKQIAQQQCLSAACRKHFNVN
jgi:hypothetical protein